MESFLEDTSGYSTTPIAMNMVVRPGPQLVTNINLIILKNPMNEYDSIETIEKDFLKCCKYENVDIIRAAGNIAKTSRRGLGNHLIMNFKSLFMLSDLELRWLGLDLDLDDIKNPKDRQMLFKLTYNAANTKRTLHFREWVDVGEVYVCYRGDKYDSVGVFSVINDKIYGFIEKELAPNYIAKVVLK